MATSDKTTTLEMRVVELENRLNALQPASAGFTDDELKTYFKLSSAFVKPWKCINECSCGPCNCDPVWVTASLVNYARFAQMAGLLSEKSVVQLTEEVAQKLAQQR